MFLTSYTGATDGCTDSDSRRAGRHSHRRAPPADAVGALFRIITSLTELHNDERIDAIVNLAGARILWMRIPAPLMRAPLGEMSQLLVDGQRVAPIRALAAGFVFEFPDLAAALDHLLAKGR